MKVERFLYFCPLVIHFSSMINYGKADQTYGGSAPYYRLADSSMQLALPVFFYWPKVHNTLYYYYKVWPMKLLSHFHLSFDHLKYNYNKKNIAETLGLGSMATYKGDLLEKQFQNHCFMLLSLFIIHCQLQWTWSQLPTTAFSWICILNWFEYNI